MSNKYQPESQPVAVIGSILIAVGIILLISIPFIGPDSSQSRDESLRAMNRSVLHASGGIGLMFLGGVFCTLAEWSWNNSQPVQSISVRVVSKWTTTSTRSTSEFTWGKSCSDPDIYAYTNYHAKFEASNGQTMDFTLSRDLYNQFAEQDFGTLTFQGGWIHTFRRR